MKADGQVEFVQPVEYLTSFWSPIIDQNLVIPLVYLNMESSVSMVNGL